MYIYLTKANIYIFTTFCIFHVVYFLHFRRSVNTECISDLFAFFCQIPLSKSYSIIFCNTLKYSRKKRKYAQFLYHVALTHFKPMVHFYAPWKRQKPKVFWRFHGVQKWKLTWNGWNCISLTLHKSTDQIVEKRDFTRPPRQEINLNVDETFKTSPVTFNLSPLSGGYNWPNQSYLQQNTTKTCLMPTMLMSDW